MQLAGLDNDFPVSTVTSCGSSTNSETRIFASSPGVKLATSIHYSIPSFEVRLFSGYLLSRPTETPSNGKRNVLTFRTSVLAISRSFDGCLNGLWRTSASASTLQKLIG